MLDRLALALIAFMVTLCVGAAAANAASGRATKAESNADQPYPNKPIRLIVPFAPEQRTTCSRAWLERTCIRRSASP